MADETIDKHLVEEAFHDQWAQSEDLSSLDVRKVFSACTSPELRAIVSYLGDIRGKKILDVGCGLGEASVFFALQGANVTATDLSSQMLAVTHSLGKRHGVEINTHKSSAESLNLPATELFDAIYVGNLFHHVDIESTIKILKNQLKPEGVLVSWDPIAYNPLINIYRKMATEVRTPDEHPLTRQDLKLFKKHFANTTFKFYWLTTLIIFPMMYLLQRHNPNKVRYWKKVVDDASFWAPLYKPLALFDRLLLTLVPPLGLLCWNVVIFSKNPRKV